MSYYFRADGTIRFGVLTLATGTLISAFTASFLLGVAPVTDSGFQTLNHEGGLRDWLLYSKVKP